MRPVVVVLDVANVMGSRPDGWWRDRAGAASRVLAGAAEVCAHAESGRGDAAIVMVVAVAAVVEGAARGATDPGVAGLDVVAAPGSGDDTIVEVARRCVERLADAVPTGPSPDEVAPRIVVVTADRGLRDRLPVEVQAVGPRWWWDVVEKTEPGGTSASRGEGGAPDREAPLGAKAARGGFRWSPGLPRPDARQV